MIITEFNKYRQEPKITYYDNGQKYTEKYYLNGNLHREGGPAEQYWYKNGQQSYEIYYLNGKYHREDGPAFQKWYSNGQKQYENYFLNDKRHREDGPTEQYWYKNGQKDSEAYYLNGKFYSRKEWLEKLKEINSPHYKEQKFIYDAEEKYNL